MASSDIYHGWAYQFLVLFVHNCPILFLSAFDIELYAWSEALFTGLVHQSGIADLLLSAKHLKL
jgi:hypothetical protein